MDTQSGTRSRARAGARLASWQFPILAVLCAAILAACSSKSKNPTGPNPAAALQLVTAPPASFASRAIINPAPVVQLVDASGDAVSTSGTAVTATLTTGTGTLGGTTVVSTNTAGQAVFSNMSIAGTVGAKAITFSSPGLTSAAANGLSLTAGAAANATATSPLAQSAQTGAAVAQLPSITVTDADGNPVAGLGVTFAITAGNGSLTGGTQTTNASGVATVTSWTVGATAGTNTMTATATGLAAVTFTVITATPGVAVELKVQTAPPATVADRATLNPAPVIQLIDVTGAAVTTSGVSVTVALTGGGTLNGSASANTDAAGQATFAGLNIAGLVGAKRLQFSSTNLVGVQSGTITLTPGPATTIAANSVVTQNGTTGAAVTALPEVKVTDADGNGVSGVGVLFTLTGGGGTIGGASQTTSASGVATLGSWSLGATVGANTVNASGNGVSLAGAPVTFTVNATAPASNYSITLQFLTSATAAQQAAFANAKARWETVITGDIPDIDVTGAPSCDGVTSTGVVDDVRILVELDSIDGPGKILGSAGPCIIRLTSRLTAIGVMRFDTADVRALELNGSLNDVILHEMGHVLGYGTLWDDPAFNFLQGGCDPAVPGSGTSPTYTGPNALAAFVGSNGGSGTSIPVENFPGSPPTCPNGTRDSHWEEDVFRSEVMTGFISGTFRPLSLTSIQSLKDLGYTTNPAAADQFSLSTQPTVRELAAQPVLADLSNDVLNIPIYAIDGAGRVTLFRDRR